MLADQIRAAMGEALRDEVELSKQDRLVLLPMPEASTSNRTLRRPRRSTNSCLSAVMLGVPMEPISASLAAPRM